jgi:hypothetical protein
MLITKLLNKYKLPSIFFGFYFVDSQICGDTSMVRSIGIIRQLAEIFEPYCMMFTEME